MLGRLEDGHHVEHVAVRVVVVRELRPPDPVQQHLERRDRCQGELGSDRLRAVIVAQEVPPIHHLDHPGDLAREGVARLDSRVREWNGVAEEDRPAVVVIVAVVPLDHLVAHVRDEFSHIEAQAGAEGRDVARERLLQVELGSGLVLCLRDLRDRVPRGEINAKAGVVRLGGRDLHHQLGDVEVEGVVIEVEDAVAARAGRGTVAERSREPARLSRREATLISGLATTLTGGT